MWNSQYNRLDSGMENGTKVTFNLSSNMICGSKVDANFLHKTLIKWYTSFKDL